MTREPEREDPPRRRPSEGGPAIGPETAAEGDEGREAVEQTPPGPGAPMQHGENRPTD